MKPTVITTGPGVIIATATASRNCRSSSQPYRWTTPACRKGTMARPLPKTKAPASVKYAAILRSVAPEAGCPVSPVRRAGGRRLSRPRGDHHPPLRLPALPLGRRARPLDDSRVQEGHDGDAAPEDEGPGLGEVRGGPQERRARGRLSRQPREEGGRQEAQRGRRVRR